VSTEALLSRQKFTNKEPTRTAHGGILTRAQRRNFPAIEK
jgi:hypothetical protein